LQSNVGILPRSTLGWLKTSTGQSNTWDLVFLFIKISLHTNVYCICFFEREAIFVDWKPHLKLIGLEWMSVCSVTVVASTNDWCTKYLHPLLPDAQNSSLEDIESVVEEQGYFQPLSDNDL
jgi:hypothetical protein